MGKGKRKKNLEERRKRQYEKLPPWKQRALQQRNAGIKSGTSDLWRDPKTGEKAKK